MTNFVAKLLQIEGYNCQVETSFTTENIAFLQAAVREAVFFSEKLNS